MKRPYFTVFTPTYNRSGTLRRRVYESLRRQTFRDLEWLVVDDGSTDDTREVVRALQTDAPFAVRYFHQENRGKPAAANVGAREARGELFLVLDDDDECVPETLETFAREWESIPRAQRVRYSTIAALCLGEGGRPIGGDYPRAVIDAATVREQLALRSTAERWGVNRTDVLREFPYPELPREKYVPEALVWNRIAQRYTARFINARLRIYRDGPDRITHQVVHHLARSPEGSRLYYRELSALPVALPRRLRAAINHLRYSFHGSVPVRCALADAGHSWAAALVPIAYVLYRVDEARLRRS